MPDFENITPHTTAFIDENNDVQDIQSVLESGAVIVTAVDPGPVTPIGTATAPKFENIAPWVGKFVNSSDEIVSLIDLLTSGAIQVQVSGGGGGGAPTTSTYITQTDETLTLTNSQPLSVLATGFLSSVTSTGVVSSRVLTQTANQIDISGGDGSSAPTFSLSSTLVLPGTVALGGNMDAGAHTIESTSGALNFAATSNIDFNSPWMSVTAIRRLGESSNKILFSPTLQQFLPDNLLQLEIGPSGIQLSTGVFVNDITNNSSSLSATSLMTAEAIRAAIAADIVSGHSFRGAYDASVNLYPSTGGSGAAGAILKGDWWYISVSGTLGINPVEVGDQVFAVNDTPAQVDANWLVIIQKVDSVFGRVGAIVATNADYSFSQISGVASATQGGTSFSSYTKGDLIHSSSFNVLSKLPIGSPGQVLTVSAGDAAWSPVVTVQDRYFDGLVVETPEVLVVSDGVNITLSLQKDGGGDLTLVYSTGLYALDTTPAITIILTPGTDISPVQNYVYIPEATKVLTISTVGFPAAQEYTAIATVLCQSVVSAQLDGVYKNHVWTDHMNNSDGSGHSQHLSYWIRSQNATWQSGIQITPTTGTGVFSIATTSGVVLQLHQHNYPSFDTSVSSHVYVPNDFSMPYNRVTDLTTILTDSTGASMSGRRFNLVVWGSVSQESGECQLFINLPDSVYNDDSGAIIDSGNSSSYNIPVEFKGSGFLISRLTVRHQNAGGGTWSILNDEDLRLLTPSTAGGGGDGSPVTSVFTRIGDVVAASGDYSFNQISGTALETQGGTGQSTYSTGEVLYASAANTLSKLAPGLNGQVLTLNIGVPSWQTLSLGGWSFVTVTTSTQALSINTVYYTTFAGLSTMTLPVSAVVGSAIKIRAGNSGNTFRVAQNLGQQILFGALLGVSQETTPGAGGYIESTYPNTCIELECVVADTTWVVVSAVNSISGV